MRARTDVPGNRCDGRAPRVAVLALALTAVVAAAPAPVRAADGTEAGASASGTNPMGAVDRGFADQALPAANGPEPTRTLRSPVPGGGGSEQRSVVRHHPGRRNARRAPGSLPLVGPAPAAAFAHRPFFCELLPYFATAPPSRR